MKIAQTTQTRVFCTLKGLEPHSLWQTYLEPAFRDLALTPELKFQGGSVTNKSSKRLIDEGSKEVARSHPLSLASEFNLESQVQAIYQMGVDMAFVYPTHLLWLVGVDNMPAPQVGAYVGAYNNWLQDFCSYNPQILKGWPAYNNWFRDFCSYNPQILKGVGCCQPARPERCY